MKKRMMIAVALIGALTVFADSAEMKLMSFNVRHCEGMDKRIDISRTARRIRAENPDFACLQEIDWRTARVNGVDVEDRVTSDHAPIVVTVSAPVPELPAPAVVPQPASLKSAKGVRFEKATEVTADLVRFIEDPSVAKEGYGYDPLAGIPLEAQRHVLGRQCCLWANRIPDEPQLQWQAWPRACATAEVF